MRVAISLGGSLLTQTPDSYTKYATMLTELKQRGHQLIVVTGGGRPARHWISLAKQLGAPPYTQDRLGIHATHLNSSMWGNVRSMPIHEDGPDDECQSRLHVAQEHQRLGEELEECDHEHYASGEAHQEPHEPVLHLPEEIDDETPQARGRTRDQTEEDRARISFIAGDLPSRSVGLPIKI